MNLTNSNDPDIGINPVTKKVYNISYQPRLELEGQKYTFFIKNQIHTVWASCRYRTSTEVHCKVTTSIPSLINSEIGPASLYSTQKRKFASTMKV